MSGKRKDSSSSSSNKNGLDEIKALLNEKFDDFAKTNANNTPKLRIRQS